MREEKTFIFTVIVPVYNQEKYLPECIDSVLGQTIGFEDNIQLILVNDVSEDRSEEICLEYQARYPDNITYIKLDEHAGPNGGRSAGIPYIRGELVNFLDSDDKWGPKAFEKAWKFYSNHVGEIDCIAGRIKCFGSSNAWHALDYIFKKTHVANVNDKYYEIQTHISSVFITADAVRRTPMNTELIRSEDTLYAIQLILRKERYGILRSARYYYRRHAGSSMTAIDRTRYYYEQLLDQFHDGLIRQSKEKYGRVHPFIQYEIMYDIQWRLMLKRPRYFNDEDWARYVEHIRSILLDIDDHIICEQRNITPEYKLQCLRMKYGDRIYDEFRLMNGGLVFRNLWWFAPAGKNILQYVGHEINRGVLTVAGEVHMPLPKEHYEIFAEDGRGKRYPLRFDARAEKDQYSFDQVCLTVRPFEVNIPLRDAASVRFMLRYRSAEIPMTITAEKFTALSCDPPEAYWVQDGYVFTNSGTEIRIEKQTGPTVKAHKRALWRGMFRRRDTKTIWCMISAALLRRLTGKRDVRISFGTKRIV